MTPFGIIKSWTVKKIIFITDFAGPVIKMDNVIWNVIVYAVFIVMIHLVFRKIQILTFPVVKKIWPGTT